MDSNPPFQVEDQTDEDFFDKLVDDDDEVKVHASASFSEGNDFDDTRAFASLSIGDVPAGLDDAVGCEVESGTEAIGETACENTNAVSLDGHVEENSSLVSSSSFGFDSVNGSIGGATGTELTSDSTISNGSGGSGIKEVQWTAFNSDSRQSNRFGSYSDFFSELGDGAPEPPGKVEDSFGVVAMTGSGSQDVKENYNNNYNSTQYQESGAYNSGTVHNVDGQDQCSTQYWENLYPGWKYDQNTAQWYQVDSYDPTTNVQENFSSNSVHHTAGADGNSHDSYLQQTSQVSAGTVSKNDTANGVTGWNQTSQGNVGSERVSNWNQTSQVNTEYPAHMVFDPQYPGWYYDTIAQEWRLLETYTSSIQSSNQSHNQQNENGYTSRVTSSQENHQTYIGSGQVDNSRSQGFAAVKQDHNWAGSPNNYNQNNLNMWQPDNIAKTETSMNFSGNQHSENDYGFKNQQENDYGSKFPVTNHASQQNSYDSRGAVPYYREATEGHNDFLTTGSSSFVSTGNFIQHINQPGMQKNDQRHLSNGYYGNQSPGNFSQQQLQSGNQFSYATDAGRSSAGRPPHALVTFGFGGKLIVAKYDTSFNTPSFETQGPVGSSISVLNLMEVVSGSTDTPNMGSIFDYFNTLCKQSYPGPLVGGSVGNKELNKWVDERIASCGSSDVDYRKDEVLKLLLSLLKIACQYYGKLRSPFGSDTALRESDHPESAVARLFSSSKENSAQFSNYGGIAHCLQKSPSEAQMLATASEVQSLLVSGKKKEALHCATEGQLWGPALVLATQLGEQFYVDTVKQMALHQLVAGSPLRTLCLLIAGQPADVFSIETTSESNIPHAVNMSLQSTQCATNYMLDGWEENLAVITANRTKDDHLVLIHLGDCLWKEKGEILAAHICYLVAEANFEQFSDSARLCLIGADHWKFPRTYASPDAIQRTELYEYAKVLGNPQFILLPFQPYKVIYAHMLAEVGKVTESLKYCQAVLKSLKAGRAPETDTCRQLISSLDERIRTYQQGGFSSNSTNLVSKKLVGKLFNFIDSTAHRVVGGLPPPIPGTSHGSPPANEHSSYQTMGLRVSSSQSTMAMSSLMPSASVEPINEWNSDGSRKPKHNRSVSEPDFGRTPIQDHADSSKQASSPDAQGKSSGGASRFGRFGFGSQLFQKTVGLVLKPRQDRQAKLGETNKFYYDEKLKRWVEEGAEAAAAEPPLPPPPTVTAFQNGGSDYSLKGGMRSEGSPKIGSPEFKSPKPSDHSSGIPPIPPASNQFSARGRAGVRSRYVDTFNKGGGNASNMFQSPSVPTNPPTGGANPKFFVPTPSSSTRDTTSSDPTADNALETTSTNEDSSMRTSTSSFHSPPPPASVSIQRFPSMDNLAHKSATATASGTLPPHSRRTASWSGSFADGYNHLHGGTGVKPLGEVLGLPPSSFMPTSAHMSIGEDLHEVEL